MHLLALVIVAVPAFAWAYFQYQRGRALKVETDLLVYNRARIQAVTQAVVDNQLAKAKGPSTN